MVWDTIKQVSDSKYIFKLVLVEYFNSIIHSQRFRIINKCHFVPHMSNLTLHVMVMNYLWWQRLILLFVGLSNLLEFFNYD